ncbi:MAG: hypothetical protein ACXVO9_11605 [Bacteroidia bacterium]
MTRIISEHYAKARTSKPEDTNWLTVKTDSLPHINGFCKVRYQSFFTVPLLVYTYSEERMECKINPKIYVNEIVTELTKKLREPVNENKISGKIIELSVNYVPTTFYHRYNSHYVALQVIFSNVYFSVTNNELNNKASSIRVSYVIRDAASSGVIRAGFLTAGIPGNYYKKSYSQRRKYFVQDYLSSFDRNLEYSSTQIANDLINQL